MMALLSGISPGVYNLPLGGSNSQRAMKLLSRVVWSEGMYLGPHHFQVQSRYFEDSIQFATSSLWFASYGLAGVELDAEALHNGTVSLLHARGIFPDGLPFNMPESDALPQPRAVADLFPPTRDDITVLLAIPPRKPNGYNCSLDDGPREWRALSWPNRACCTTKTPAPTSGPSGSGRKNLRLLFDTEPAGDLIDAADRARGARRLRPLRLRPELRPAGPADQRQHATDADGAAADRDSRR